MNDSSSSRCEFVEGYVIDAACLRRADPVNLHLLGAEHEKSCALMNQNNGGYVVITDGDQPVVLDEAATPLVTRLLEQHPSDQGIRIRVQRRVGGGRAVTTDVASADGQDVI